MKHLEKLILEDESLLNETAQLWYLNKLHSEKGYKIDTKEFNFIENKYKSKYNFSDSEIEEIYTIFKSHYEINGMTIKFIDDYAKVLKSGSKYNFDIVEDKLLLGYRQGFIDIEQLTDLLYDYIKSDFKIDRIPAKRMLKKYKL